MCRDPKPRPLGGPWLVILRRVKAGNNDVARLKLCAANAAERSRVKGNVDAMKRNGFLAETNGKLFLTDKARAAT